ncbi:hypothetical protein [Vibrio breoganii]|uniref:hypothetical protein n=1 Tax=Vibrio breoganii TaxID=553239 RepID=UPI0012EAF32D|nr:hypothetical protein [Vibrio breoganii]
MINVSWYLKNRFWLKQFWGVTLVRSANGFFVMALLAMQSTQQEILLGLVINNVALFLLNAGKSHLRHFGFERYVAIGAVAMSLLMIFSDAYIHITLSILIALLSTIKDEDSLKYNVTVKRFVRALKTKRKNYLVIGSTLMGIGLVFSKPIVGLLADIDIRTLYIAILLYSLKTLQFSLKTTSKEQKPKETLNQEHSRPLWHYTQSAFWLNISSAAIGVYVIPVVLFDVITNLNWADYKFTLMSIIGAVSGAASLAFYTKPKAESIHAKMLSYSMSFLVVSIITTTVIFVFREQLSSSVILCLITIGAFMICEIGRIINTSEYVTFLNTLGQKHFGFNAVLDSFFAARSGGTIVSLIGLYSSFILFGTADYWVVACVAISTIFHFYALLKGLYTIPSKTELNA